MIKVECMYDNWQDAPPIKSKWPDLYYKMFELSETSYINFSDVHIRRLYKTQPNP